MILLLAALPAPALAADLTEEAVDTRAWEELLQELDRDYAASGEGLSLSELWRQQLDPGGGGSQGLLSQVWSWLGATLWGQLRANVGLLGQVLALSVLSLLLSLLADSLAGAESARLASWVVSLLLLALAVSVFSQCLTMARSGVDTVSDVLFVLLPLLMPLLAALGGISTVALISPALLFCLNILMQVLKNVVFPLIWCCALLRLCSQLAPGFKVKGLASLCQDAALGLLGVTSTLFVAFLSLSGLSAAGRDGLAVKAAKTASSAFIPVVGRTLADSLDSVLGTVLLLKGAVGLTGSLALLLVCGLPALSILVRALLFRLAGALVEPLGQNDLAQALSGMGRSLTLLFAALAVAGLFAYFALALTVALGAVTMMMR